VRRRDAAKHGPGTTVKQREQHAASKSPGTDEPRPTSPVTGPAWRTFVGTGGVGGGGSLASA
jgi:hypothetical protein